MLPLAMKKGWVGSFNEFRKLSESENCWSYTIRAKELERGA